MKGPFELAWQVGSDGQVVPSLVLKRITEVPDIDFEVAVLDAFGSVIAEFNVRPERLDLTELVHIARSENVDDETIQALRRSWPDRILDMEVVA